MGVEDLAILLYRFTPKIQGWDGDPYMWHELREETRNKYLSRARSILTQWHNA